MNIESTFMVQTKINSKRLKMVNRIFHHCQPFNQKRIFNRTKSIVPTIEITIFHLIKIRKQTQLYLRADSDL